MSGYFIVLLCNAFAIVLMLALVAAPFLGSLARAETLQGTSALGLSDLETAWHNACSAPATEHTVSQVELLERLSFQICAQSDGGCRQRFFWDARERGASDSLFYYLHARMLDDMGVEPAWVLDDMCRANSTRTWKIVLDAYHFCSDNEIPDRHGRCICRPGKVCHEEPSGHYLADIGFNNLLILGLIILLVYLFFRSASQRSIAQSSAAQRAQAQRVLDAREAQRAARAVV